MTTLQTPTGPAGTAPPEREAERRQLARKRLEDRRGFRSHVFIYVTVNAMIWLIWFVVALSSGSWFPWPVFPMAGWGVGLAANAWAVYAERPITEDMVDEELRRLGPPR